MLNAETGVRSIFADKLGIPPAEVKLDETFETSGMDSLDVAELAISFEEEFSCSVGESDEDAWKTPADMVAYARQHKMGE